MSKPLGFTKNTTAQGTNLQGTNKKDQDEGGRSSIAKMTPSQLLQRQLSGNILEDFHKKPKIVQFLNIGDFSIYKESRVPIDEPLFEPLPPLIQFTDYEPLQIKEKVFRLRNKDSVARRVKIIPPDSRLFQVITAAASAGEKNDQEEMHKVLSGSKVAPGMEISFIIRFSPEAKIDYTYDLIIVTEREKFIVPIVAVGKRAMIDFPDSLDFGNCPVKYNTEKPILIRNLGEKTTKWTLKLPFGFDASKREGILEYGKTEQIILKFSPTECKTYKGESILSYDNLEAYIPMSGVAYNGNVYLSKSYIQLEDAYIGLHTQQTLQIVNKSNVRVDFQWRAFATEKEEIEKKNKLRLQLEQEEAEERMLLKEVVTAEPLKEEYEIGEENDSDESMIEERELIARKQKKAEMLLARKYRNIRKAIEDDLLLFEDDIFHIEPISGQIWPNSEMTVTITFKPEAALHYSCTSYCNISCSEERLPLHMAGEGIGPKAFFSFTELEMGNVFVTSRNVFPIVMENRGDIDARFELISNHSPFGQCFKFSVDKGTLPVGERMNFQVEFCSSNIGPVSETFYWKLEGSSELLSITFKGRVIPPSFELNKTKIDFDKVSYSFPKRRDVTITNTSKVPFRFALRIPGDGKTGTTKEFDIKPARDTLNPDESRLITIDFTPYNPKKYDMYLVVDIEGIGVDMHTIPITAVCEVPTVQIHPSDELDYGPVFLRFAYVMKITLVNTSDLDAKFEIAPQTVESKVLATIQPDQEKGIIPSNSSVLVTVSMTTNRLNGIDLPLYITIVGAPNMPHMINLKAFSHGPKVEPSQTEVDFEKVEVLKDASRKIRLLNKSKIEADFHAFTQNKNSIFRPIQKKGVLGPEEALDIEIVCSPDDVGKFSDKLYFVIKEGMDVEVNLRVQSFGTTIFCKDKPENVDFGTQYTFRNIIREFFIENKGRKEQTINWARKKVFEKKKILDAKDSKKPAKEEKKEEEKDELDFVFTIVPEEISLKPKTGVMFQFRANSTRKGPARELFTLQSRIGNERKPNIVWETVIVGEFINPTLIFSEPKLYFKYVWAKNVPALPLSKNLEISCGSPLPVNFLVKVAKPFDINADSFSLLPGKSCVVRVDFDPSLKYDRVSDVTKSKLQIIHTDHPYREYLDLIGEVCFPNLSLESQIINFNAILNDTTKKISITMKNVSEMALNYEWAFIEDEKPPLGSHLAIGDEEQSQQNRMLRKGSKNTIGGSSLANEIVPINEVFDILPLNGMLEPGEVEKVEFIYHAIPGQKYRATGVCHVEGGPDYEVTLLGEGSTIVYKINPPVLDLGEVPFSDWKSVDLNIENLGKVTFEYLVNLDRIVRKGLIDISSFYGVVGGGEKQKITIRLCPGLPDDFVEHFTIQVAYFEPEKITIRGRGISPNLLFNMPRIDLPEFKAKAEKARPDRSANPALNISQSSINNKSFDKTAEVTTINEMEGEIDRRVFCDQIMKNIQSYNQQLEVPQGMSSAEKWKSQSMLKTSSFLPGRETKFYDRIVLAAYTFDFGNVVLGSTKKRSFKMMNVGEIPATIQFDTKNAKASGYTISIERISRLPTGQTQEINITFQAKKTLKFGRQKCILPVEIKNGPRYNIELWSNITIPEFTLTSDTIDFGKVIIGMRKTVYVRLENNKEVMCEWALSLRQEIQTGGDEKEENVFAIIPTSGKLAPGKKQTIQLTFIPTGEKPYNHKFNISIKENPKLLPINVSGQGTAVSLRFNPDEMNFGSILPYDNEAMALLEIKNPSEYEVEVFSLDFDNVYLEDEDTLSKYGAFANAPQQFLPVRQPGQPFWNSITKSVKEQLKREELTKKLKELEARNATEEEKAPVITELDSLNVKEIEYPTRIDESLRNNIIIFGPVGCGKSSVANFLNRETKRGVLNMNEILDWNLSYNTEIGKLAQSQLEQKAKKLEEVLAEREKMKKKKPKKGEEEPPIRPEEYGWLDFEILVELLRERMKFPDCNVGAIFDNLTSKYWENELVALKVILEVLAEQTVQMVNLHYLEDESGELCVPIKKNTKAAVLKPEDLRALKRESMILKGKDASPRHGGSPKAAGDKSLSPSIKKVKTDQKKDVGGTSPKAKAAGDAKKAGNNIKVKIVAPGAKGEKNATNQTEEKKDEINEEQAREVEELRRAEEEQHREEERKRPVFELNFPKEMNLTEKATFKELSKRFVDFFMGKIKDITFQPPPPVPEPVKEEAKKPEAGAKAAAKDTKKVPAAPEKKVVVEEPVLQVQTQSGNAQPEELQWIQPKNRIITDIPIVYNLHQLHQDTKEYVPDVIYPDPESLPLPEPVLHQILTKPAVRAKREAIKNFMILTPKTYLKPSGDDTSLDFMMEENKESPQKSRPWETKSRRTKTAEKKDEPDSKQGKKKKSGDQSPGPEDGSDENKDGVVVQRVVRNISTPNFPKEELLSNQYRWIIPSKRSIYLVVKFYSKVVGDFKVNLGFESFFSVKPYNVPVVTKSEFPSVNTNYKNVFFTHKNKRPTNPPEAGFLSKTYVVSENSFDFGPLLIGKNPANRTTDTMKNVNSCIFRITNNGNFNTRAQFGLATALLDDLQQKPDYKKGIFFFEPESVELKMGETGEVRVWAIPDAVTRFRDELVVVVKDNPMPAIFPMFCQGVKPKVDIEAEVIDFDRLLLQQKLTKQVKVKNVCQLPVKWKLAGVEALPTDFKVANFEGVLTPNQETIVSLTFEATKQMKYTQKLTLQVEDVEGLSVKQEPKDITIKAEAFFITVNASFPNQENLLDFGAVRVGDIKDQAFSIKNVGSYPVKFAFTMKKKLFRDNFKIEPAEGMLDPNTEKQIVVRFQSKSEIKMRTTSATSDIVMEILEGKSLESFEKVVVNVAVNSVFSKYSIAPLKNINFGPIQFNEQKIRNFELKNEGQFEFQYIVFDYNDNERRKAIKAEAEEKRAAELAAQQQQLLTSKDPKAAGKKDAPVKKPDPPKGKEKKGELPATSLKIGQFIINPAIGTIAPDSAANIEVTFVGGGAKLLEQKLGIEISYRDPEDQPQGVLYEVIGESCVPGINADNYESIFEEQIVVQSLASGQNVQNMVNSNVFSCEENTFYFGTLVPSKNPDGIVEKFKITNPNKIPCNVKFDVRKRPQSLNDQFAFEVQPKTAKIPPHEHTYVKVQFKPTIMASYTGLFEALVENGEQNPKSQKLIFDLRGEGALPTLKVEKPKDWADERTLLLKFPKTRVGKTVTLPIVLKNDGQVPATVKFDLSGNEHFRFIGQNMYTLTPKSYQTFNVEFRPKDAGPKQWSMLVNTLLNPYESPKIQIVGEGYHEEVVFESLPNDMEDEAVFGDCIIAQERRIPFVMKSNAKNLIRFAWSIPPGVDEFRMLPSVGHIEPNGSKAVQLIFRADKTITYDKLALACEIKGITQTNPGPSGFIDWDDGKTNVRYVTPTEYNWVMKKREEEERRRKEEDLAKLSKKGAKKETKPPAGKKGEEVKPDEMPPIDPNEEATVKLEETIPEPPNNVIEKTEKTVTLKGSAIADFAKYETETKEIVFKPTLMYTSRVHKFRVKNTSLIKIKYLLKLVNSETGVYDSGYYTVSPKTGYINPSCDEVFTVTFSPTEVQDDNSRLLVFSIENLDPNIKPLIIEIDGEAERPICHFELPPNDIRSKQEYAELDSKYNIVVLESLGTKIKNSKKFYVVNPTNMGYEYEWRRSENPRLATTPNLADFSSFFKCVTSRGVVLSGKKAEMIFEYTPDIVGSHESFWTFEIPSEKIVQHFLFVGNVLEPTVFFDVGKVNFGPLLIGGRNVETVKLKNIEHIPFSFNFTKESVLGQPDYADSLMVSPLSGVVNPDSEVAIQLTFQPRIETSFNYNIMCNVKRKSRPVMLNVKGIGYNLHHRIFYDRGNTPLESGVSNIIDFGDIFVNERRSRILTIENLGDFNFDFVMKKSQFNFVTINPETGTVKRNDKLDIEVTFAPIGEYKLKPKQHQIHLMVISGPTYNFDFFGSARKPTVDLSFTSYDFGPCFVMKQPMPQTIYLEMVNRDNAAMSIEMAYEKSNSLDVALASGQVLLPSTPTVPSILKIPITFTPRELKKYEENIVFDINNLHKINVKIQGEGIPFKLELEKVEEQNIDFGVQRVGTDVTKVIRVNNNSRRAIHITFDIPDQKDSFGKYALSYLPTKDLFFNPRETKEIELRFTPTTRLHAFKKELYYKIVDNQETRKLLNISGACHGIELKLMEDTIGFGAVVVNSKVSKKVQVSNLGDIGAKFQWDTTFCRQFFTIQPERGFIPANEDLFFEVIFHPNVIDNDIRFNKVRCDVENAEPLHINLLGKCVPQTKENIFELKFDTVVRTPAKQKVILKNPTSQPWRIKCNISTVFEQFRDYFQAKPVFEVPANSQAEYEVIYNPLTMTKTPIDPEIKDEIHDGTLFFPLPDGTAILYNLIGKSQPPNPEGTVDLTIKAKKDTTHTINVKNWLKTTQRFQVTWVIDGNDPTIFISGANTIDINGDGTKQYKINLFGLKQGAAKFTLTFKNEVTHEFIFYRVNLVIQPPDLIAVLKMSSFVRETSSKIITVRNPLKKPAEFKKEMVICETDMVIINPATFTIPPESEFGIELLYRPLLGAETKSKLTLKHPDLGDYQYELQLQGLPATTQRALTFKSNLGSDIVQSFKFINYVRKPTVYSCRIEKFGAPKQAAPIDPKAKPAAGPLLDFIAETPTINAAPTDLYEGTELAVNIRYEPATLGESKAVLYVTSPEGGEYQCTLTGISAPPQPKGPFKIGGAKPPPIDFKNPFLEAAEFIIRIDNPCFTASVKSPVKVDAKKALSITVSYKAQPGFSNTGRLMISTGDLPPWVFYLQGE